MIERVSKTAAFGSLQTMPELFDQSFRIRLEMVFRNIESGSFNRQLRSDAADGFPALNRLLKEARKHPCQQAVESFGGSEDKS
jgi:ketol-acid reductoisomerase